MKFTYDTDKSTTVDVYSASIPGCFGSQFLFYSSELKDTLLSATNGWGTSNCKNF